MKITNRIVSVLIVITLSSIGLGAKAQPQSSRVNASQVGDILERLAQSSDRFRNSLNIAVDPSRADKRPENDINSFERDFENATNQLNDRFKRRRAEAADVRNVLQKASPINDFIGRRSFDTQVQNDWTSVRSDLEALATAYAVNWRWNPQTFPPLSTSRSYRLADRELDQLIRHIENGGDRFRLSLTDAFDLSRYDPTRREGNMNDAVQGFKKATNQLSNRFDAKQLVAGDVEHLLKQAIPVDAFMRNNKLTDRVQTNWSTLRDDLEALGSAYNIAPNWGNSPSPQTRYSGHNRLTGTFRLDPSRSDNPRDKADRATGNLADNERQDVHEQIMARLESPQMLAIERQASTVTIASSLAPQAKLEADGRERQEELGNDRSVRVTATLRGDQLVVNSNGYKENDFNVTFDASENDRSLRVRRQIYSGRLTQPVVVDSVYDRTSDAAQWSVYTGSRAVLNNTGPRSGDFIVRDGERVVAVLNTDLTTKDAKRGDRFDMTVRHPTQYAGAVIEARIASVDRSGRLSERSLSLNFETIRLRNGETYGFAGILASVRKPNGDTVKVDNEGSAQGDNQTTQTIQRAGIGNAIGGIIGAGGGAGSVYVQGKDNLELPSGTELTIRASAPR